MPLVNNPEDEKKINDYRSRIARGEEVPAEELAWAVRTMRGDRRSAATTQPKAKASKKSEGPSALDILNGLLG